MAIVKVIELLSESKESWEDATAKAVVKASESIKNIRSANVSNLSATVKDGKVDKYRVNVKMAFAVED